MRGAVCGGERNDRPYDFSLTSNAVDLRKPITRVVLTPETLLPPSLLERLHPVGADPIAHRGAQYVLYWARTAVRAYENPALNTALTVAAALNLPVFVYHALSERYPYASDRHHMFILEGARDFAAQLTARGIGSAFHLERDGNRGAHLRAMAQHAALVVTELMPVAPLVAWTAALRESITAPVWEVDTACVVPVTLTTRAFDRAFAYRDATAPSRRARLTQVWHDIPVAHAPFVPPLPFAPINLSTADLAELISQCRIDHSVGPVADTRGGSAAGYARWNNFVNSGRIHQYDRVRNDPTRGDGVSRMSAYLHYGMVSPFRLAREAAALNGDGASKWLDELLVWRELAYTFCYHTPNHDRVAALPAWARETLRAHESDHREVYDWERLARGTTSSAFWNAMQRSLLAHGEIHNNVRMTWGKAFAAWTPNAERALALSIDLNHRYALDGRDPASYGGLLWCLGQFDRPFTPPNRVMGSVRGRAVSEQAARINVDRYTNHVRRDVYPTPRSVAIVGAGLSGLLCARTLADHNLQVTVFEKSRGFGGRCATRRDGPWQFDHGAQYFTIRDPRLAPLTKSWAERGLIAPWDGKLAVRENGIWQPAKTGVRRWVGVPGMSAIGAHLADALDVRRNTTVAQIEREGQQWQLRADTGEDLGVFDVVLTCVPAAQAAALLTPVAPDLVAQCDSAVMHATCATMLVFTERPAIEWDGAFVNDDPVLGWFSRDASKPGRGADETWVLHANRTWSAAHINDDADSLAGAMTDAFESLIGQPLAAVHRVGHRWRYALPDPVAPHDALFNAALQLGAGGDWCGGPRIEGAFLSGMALAGRVLTHAHLASA
jgi:photolyase PhrII